MTKIVTFSSMEQLNLYLGQQKNGQQKKRYVAALGNFDGYHIGHQAVIQKCLFVAQQKDANPVILTFSPHPKIFFETSKSSATSHSSSITSSMLCSSAEILSVQDKFETLSENPSKIKRDNLHSHKMIYTDQQNIEILSATNISEIWRINFDDNIAMMSANTFIHHLTHNNAVKAIITGHNFRFGRNRQGDTQTLVDASNDHWSYHLVPKVMHNNKTASSTYVKEMLLTGNITSANEILGRKYTIHTTLSHCKDSDAASTTSSQQPLPSAAALIVNTNDRIQYPKAGEYNAYIHIPHMNRKFFSNLSLHHAQKSQTSANASNTTTLILPPSKNTSAANCSDFDIHYKQSSCINLLNFTNNSTNIQHDYAAHVTFTN